MDRIDIENSVNIFKGGHPIIFAHKRFRDSAEHHNLHINNYVEVYVYVSGDVGYVVNDCLYELRRGDIVVINPHEVHKAVLHSECEYERFYILIPTDLFSVFSFDPLSKILNRPKSASSLIDLDESRREKALGILYEISDVCRNNDGTDGLAAYSLIMQLLCIINSCTLSGKSELMAEKSPLLPKLIKDVLLYIDRNLGEISSVGDVASAFHVSLPYLSSSFRKNIGVPMNVYIRTRKVGKAKELLDSGHSVTYACYESGFSDCSYFIKCFRQSLGITPHRYKSRTVTEKQRK